MIEKARLDGVKFGQALGVLIGRVNSPERQSALFHVARVFAQVNHYSDVDSAFAYIEGFMSAFPTPAQLSAASGDEREHDA